MHTGAATVFSEEDLTLRDGPGGVSKVVGGYKTIEKAWSRTSGRQKKRRESDGAHEWRLGTQS